MYRVPEILDIRCWNRIAKQFQQTMASMVLRDHIPPRPSTILLDDPKVGDAQAVIDQHLWKIANLEYSKLPDYQSIDDSFWPLFLRTSMKQLIECYDKCETAFKTQLADQEESKTEKQEEAQGLQVSSSLEKKRKHDEENEKESEEAESPLDIKVFRPTPRLPYLDVFGNSGSGKSSTIFRLFCIHDGPKLFITNDASSNDRFHIRRCNGRVVIEHVLDVTSQELRAYLKTVPATADASHPVLVVFHGAYVNNPINSYCELIQERRWFVVKCSSGGPSTFKATTQSLLTAVRFLMPGFTMSEYKSARLVLQKYHPNLANMTDADLQEVFNIVGGNSRLFFQHLNVPKNILFPALRDSIDSIICIIHRRKSAMRGDVSESSASAINSLLNFTAMPGTSTPVESFLSRYAAEQLLCHCELQEIESERHIVPDNPLYMEWLHEAEMFARFRLSHLKRTTNMFELHNAKGIKFMEVQLDGGVQIFDSLDAIQKYDKRTSSAVWTLYKPGRCDHEGYDAMLVHSNGAHVKVYILQCTVSTRHSCNLKTSGQFLDRFFGKKQEVQSQPVSQSEQQEEGQTVEPEESEEPDEDFAVPTSVVQTRARKSLTTSVSKGMRNLFIRKPATSRAHPQLHVTVEYVIVAASYSIKKYQRPRRGTNEQRVRIHDPRFSIRERFHVYTMKLA